MAFVSINPATGRRIRSYPAATAAEIDHALARAHTAQRAWRQVEPAERARRVGRVAKALRRHTAELSALATEEMGKPIAQAEAEIAKCALGCEFYARHAAEFLAEEHPPHAPAQAVVRFEPLGVVLAIMPWNFPYWQVLRAAIPALCAGNAVLLKHAPNVSACALVIEELFREADLPGGLFRTLLLPNERVPDVIADPRLQAVTLTGSTRAGRIVGGLAGQAMKKAVFELGGSDAYLILEDADLERAAEICAESRLINSGQSCICAKRFIVAPSVRRRFEKLLAERMAARAVGDPREPSTQVGPLAREDLRDHLEDQVRATVRRGARVLLGGRRIPGPGYFYPPTLLTSVPKTSPGYGEELFGPVGCIVPPRGDSIAAAVAVANDTPYGLGAAVFSSDLAKARRIAAQLDVGSVFINDFVRSDPSLPFGGVKLSGHGRELGAFGLREFTNLKTVSAARP